jgi:DNA mismatch repair protein MutS2
LSFFVTQKTLERLEWSRVLAMLAEHARTPGGRARCAAQDPAGLPAGAALFESTRSGVLERLSETAEARRIIRTGDVPPLAGAAELDTPLARARKDGVLGPRELLELSATLAATRATRRFLETRSEAAPQLAELAEMLVEHAELERSIDAALEPSGEIRDSASPALAAARRESHRLASTIQEKVGRYLRDPGIAAHLSDSYYTVRNDRYVLPVRTDARTNIRGIVHDSSNSGQTLFVEPEPLVELNNELKRAEIAIERETLRILRGLSQRARSAADEIEANLATLEIIDLAFARGALAEELDAVAPEVRNEGRLSLPLLRHPLLLPDEAVPSDVWLGESYTALILSGPNAGGKTVALKSVALAALFVRAGMHVPSGQGSRVDIFDEVLAHIGDEQDLSANLSTFSAQMSNLAQIVNRASDGSLVVLDEVGVGTDPGEGAALAQAVLEALADRGARVIATTHYNLLKEMAEVDDRFANASVEFDPDTLQPTYRLHMGLPGVSSATAVAARMGLAPEVIERANELLDREDRQLDRVLSELSASRSALESEQREIARVRLETEAVRTEHRQKLEKLLTRRDKLFRTMREDLEKSFREAHERVAQVIRDLQRGSTAGDAADARRNLQSIASVTESAQREAGLEAHAGDSLNPIDWSRASPGDPVQIDGGTNGVLIALPDSRGRVSVRLGSARVSVPIQRVGAANPETQSRSKRAAQPRVRFQPSQQSNLQSDAEAGDAGRCHLAGLRTDEAIDRLVYALDRAASAGRSSLVIIHGLGTGALRSAVRRHLEQSAYVSHFASASQEEGGDGVTLAILR